MVGDPVTYQDINTHQFEDIPNNVLYIKIQESKNTWNLVFSRALTRS